MKHKQLEHTKQHLFFKLLLIISLCFVALNIENKSQALETEIVVSPAIIDAPVEVGASVTRSIEVRNGSDFALPISIEVQSAQTGAEYIEGVDKSRFNVANWVDFKSSTYVFEPGETKRLPFTITAPFTALAGGHYAQISIRSLSLEQDTKGQTGALVFPEVAIPLLVTVPGEITEEIVVNEKFGLPVLITPNSTLSTTIPVENRGTIHDRVQAKLVVRKDSAIVETIEFDPFIIYPYTRKNIPSEWTVDSFGVYTFQVELTYGSKNKIFATPQSSAVSTPPLSSLLTLAIAVWGITFAVEHRRNIASAARALVRGH